MACEWTTEIFRIWRCKETLMEFGYREIDEEAGNHFQEDYEHELEKITMLKISSCTIIGEPRMMVEYTWHPA